MADKSWRWYLLGEKQDRPQEKNNASTDCHKPSPNIGATFGHPIDAPISRPLADNEIHEAAERNYWKKQLRISACLNRITALAAIAAVVGLGFVAKGLVETQSATIEANRAWLGIYKTVFEREIDDPKGLAIMVYVQNSGRAPATDVKTGGTWTVIPLSKKIDKVSELPVSNLWSVVDEGIKSQCRSVKPLVGGTSIFAFSNDPGMQTELAAPNPIPDMGPVKDHSSVIIAPGCLTYISFGQTRHTGFCQFATDVRNPSKWEWLTCPAGNFAE